MQTWRKFHQLSAPSRALLLQSAAALAATWIALRVVGYRAWKALLNRAAKPAKQAAIRTDAAADGSAAAIARLQEAAARHLFLRTNCLEQSLVLCWLLQRRGIAAQMRIGARKHGGSFEAHAWVELNGAVLNDAPEHHRQFAALGSLNAVMETEIP